MTWKFAWALAVWAGLLQLASAEEKDYPEPAPLNGEIKPPPAPFDSFGAQPSGVPTSERNLVTGASVPEKVWSLPELMDEALKRNPKTRSAWETANAAAAQVGVSKAAYWPTVSLGGTGQAGHTTNSQFFTDTEVDQLSIAPQLQIQYLLLDFGARSAGVRQSRFALLSENFNFNQSLQTVVLGVMTAYYNLDGAKAALENAEAAQAQAEASSEATSIRLNSGLASSTDEAQARQVLEQARYDVENARGSLKNAEVSLAASLGLPANTKLEVEPPQNPPSLEVLDLEVDKLVDLAFSARPDLAAKYNNWRSQLAAVDQAEANRWPQLTVNGSASRTYYTADVSGQDFNGHYDDATIGLSLSFDVFDGGLKSSQVKAARSQAAAARADLMDSELGAIADVVTSFVDYKTAARRVQAAQALLEASQKSYDSTQIGYDNGLNSILDLLTSQSNLASSRSTLAQSRTDLFLASANLSYATGSLVPVPTAVTSNQR